MAVRRHSVPAGFSSEKGGFIKGVTLKAEAPLSSGKYPFSIPAVCKLGRIALDPAVTFFVGDNGSGKSTLIEAIAVAAGFNAEGGSRNFNFATRASESDLQFHIQLIRNYYRERTGYFLRAESVFNVATQIDTLDSDPDAERLKLRPIVEGFGGVPLHEQSHGESFLAIANNRFGPKGLYILDEPEAALSPSRQIAFLRLMNNLVKTGCQLIVATHSPILMAYPDAVIYRLDEAGIGRIEYEDTDHFRVTRDFLANREAYLRHLFEE